MAECLRISKDTLLVDLLITSKRVIDKSNAKSKINNGLIFVNNNRVLNHKLVINTTCKIRVDGFDDLIVWHSKRKVKV